MLPAAIVERIGALNLDVMTETAVRDIVQAAMDFKLKATVDDTPRARLFREAKPALLALGIAPSRAGALIVQWLKITHDDEQLVLATILRAQDLSVAEAPSWILATLKGRTNGKASHSLGGFSGLSARLKRTTSDADLDFDAGGGEPPYGR
jgi:hypothetical protein